MIARSSVPLATAKALFIAALFATSAPTAARAAVILPSNFVLDSVVGGLNAPTSFAFLPDGRFFVIEQKTGKVRLIVNGHVAATDPALIVPSLVTSGSERGLLGIAVDPAWPTRPFVYLYYNRATGFVRLVRYTASGTLTGANAENLTLGNSLLLMDDILDETIFHQAGCLRFGPDGMLYVALGDDAFDCEAFDVTSLHGQILRLKVDGLGTGGGAQVSRASITPADNPFVGNADLNARLVFAWGLRNPWRFQIDPVSGVIYGCDVGDNDFEEVDEIHAGNFMGWPYREANMIRTLIDCPEPGGPGATPYTAPIANFARDTNNHAVISAGMYRPVTGGANNWPPSYYPNRGDVFYTDYFTGDLQRITWNGSSWVPAAPVTGQPNASTWASGLLSASDFQVGPDGSLWWMRQYDENFTASSGGVFKIRYAGTTAVGPAAPAARVLHASPNPFSRSVELSFALTVPERVKLGVFDLSGRRVAMLFDGPASTGETRVRWNGLDAGGAVAAAGMYFVRLERGAEAPVTIRVLHER